MLQMHDLHKRFSDAVALDGCSLVVERGQMLGFLGPNGSGKTTAMRTIFGLVRPDAGTVTWSDESLTSATRKTFGYMPEERGLYPKMRVRDQLVYLGRLHGMGHRDAEEAVDRWLDVFGLTDRSSAKVQDLSHGNQQRVQLIAALAHQPPLLVLDEPFAGLDPIAAHTMAAVLRSRAEAGAAVLFSSHQLDVVEGLCEDVVIINDGKVILSGHVNRLRAATKRRYLNVVFTGRFDPTWCDRLGSAQVIEKRPDGGRLLIEGDTDVDRLALAVATAGEVTQFSLEPPPLSEIFREVVTQ